ncbi:MAG TPA: CRISPR-associated endonuclease Cas2 [Anaerolineae bacterium]|nr:CRISPR-associated endonuclease Cas2 [Anaerolineae bacterium]
MAKIFVVVAYDISDDARRTKLHDTLKNFGTPVQYSVFECILDRGGLKKMKAAVSRVIKEDRDLVRYYYLCRDCRARTETTAGAEVTRERRTIVV